ncbi:MAG: cysteine--tRNA ligase [Candidatus Moranbacteria bacterium]|nr:cysteine--tRNA ligase [Candidatus Moranbacteria bacterium]
MKLYNTLSGKKEEFKSINPGKVSMYTCGPTVYGKIHIGNMKAYMTADVLRRHLEYSGYEVRAIKNITDAGHLTEDDIAQGDSGEDKMVKKSLEEKKTPEEIATFYENYFRETEKELNILPAKYFPRVTTHIGQMIKMIEKLIEKEYAYEKNGNVFFDVTKFDDYGKLSGNTLENLKVGARLEEHPDKKNPWDFALWLKAPKGHIMRWNSPWSEGYPGWHIECSAMSLEYLGETIDIHTGGEDNIFPHHEAEIAQSECATGKKFVNYWVHTRHLNVDNKKMSKSKGNLFVLEDIKEKGFSAMDLRLLLLSSHYRSNLNFTWNSLEQAHKNLQKISDFVFNVSSIASSSEISNVPEKEISDFSVDGFKEKFEAAMNDDLNLPQALGFLFELITKTNTLISENHLDKKTAKKILSTWERINTVLGLKISGQAEIPEEIKRLAEEREEARKNKDFKKSDDLRDLLKEKGYVIEDTGDGYKLKK